MVVHGVGWCRAGAHRCTYTVRGGTGMHDMAAHGAWQHERLEVNIGAHRVHVPTCPPLPRTCPRVSCPWGQLYVAVSPWSGTMVPADACRHVKHKLISAPHLSCRHPFPYIYCLCPVYVFSYAVISVRPSSRHLHTLWHPLCRGIPPRSTWHTLGGATLRTGTGWAHLRGQDQAEREGWRGTPEGMHAGTVW